MLNMRLTVACSLFLAVLVLAPSALGGLPTVLDGNRCPGTSIPPVATDEWGIESAFDDDGDPPIDGGGGQVDATSNITYIWFGVNSTDRDIYFALAREGDQQSSGSGDALFIFYMGMDCDISTGDPDHSGADYALTYENKPNQYPNLGNPTLYKWIGTGYDEVPQDIYGFTGSLHCNFTDNKFSELCIGIEYLMDPCSQSGCNNITLLSGAAVAGGDWHSRPKDECEVNGTLHVNAPPIAYAGPDQTICLGDTAYFDGSDSLGGDEAQGYNDIDLYQWDFDYDGNPDNFTTMATGPVVSYVFTAPGTYQVGLNVTDRWGCCRLDIDGMNLTVLDLHPNMIVTKTADTFGPLQLGDTVTYTITLNNTGDANFTHLTVSDEMIDSLALVPTVNNSDGILNISEVWQYTGTHEVTGYDSCLGWINNTATVSAMTACGEGTWHSNQLSIPVDYSGICADYVISKTSWPGMTYSGNNVAFIINITNTGIIPLTDLRVVDVLPQGMIYLWDNSTPPASASGNILTWENVGPIAVGASKFIEIIAKVQL